LPCVSGYLDDQHGPEPILTIVSLLQLFHSYRLEPQVLEGHIHPLAKQVKGDCHQAEELRNMAVWCWIYCLIQKQSLRASMPMESIPSLLL